MADDSQTGGHSGVPNSEPPIAERVQELTWALVDQQISDDEVRLLDNLLLSDDGARDTYVGCIQLHVDLLARFSTPDAEAPICTDTPVLGFLSGETPPYEPNSPRE